MCAGKQDREKENEWADGAGRHEWESRAAVIGSDEIPAAGVGWPKQPIGFCYHGYTWLRPIKFASVLPRRPRDTSTLATCARRCLTGCLPASMAERSFSGSKTLTWSAAKRVTKPS